MPQQDIQPTDDQIRTRAYYLWEADGRPSNRDWEYWNKAKEQLSAKSDKPGTNGSTRKTSPTSTVSEPAKKKTNSRSPVYA
jgi:hypothetical protein